MPKPLPIVILTPRQVVTESLGIKLGGVSGDGRRRGSFTGGGAAEGGRYPSAEQPGLRQRELGARCEATKLERDGHVDEV